jgi:thiol:disulfide interchange protein
MRAIPANPRPHGAYLPDMRFLPRLLPFVILALLAPFAGLAARLQAAEPLARLHKNGVTVVITLEQVAHGQGVLVGTFTPDAKDDPLHLYGIGLSGPVGVATCIEIKAGEAVRSSGALTADQQTHPLPGDTPVPVYPPGAVTVRLPIALAASADGASQAVTVLVSYMACTEKFCLIPVVKAALSVALPTVAGAPAGAPPPAAAISPEQLRALVRDELATERTQLVKEVAAEIVHANERAAAEHGGIRWSRPKDVKEVELLIDQAHRGHQSVLLDFTGPSCLNCQTMEKTVFRLPAVVAAWNHAAAISINTDPPFDALADWQQQRFQTQNRPLYVRLDADGTSARWNQVFDPGDRATLERFLAFLGGGGGSDQGTGHSAGEFVWLALLGGLFTLLMPCTYPMIPFTVNFFAKQAAAGRRLAPLAAFYAAGIISCFVGLGVLITGVLGANLSTVSGHPITNLVIAALFAVLGLSLLGAFLLRLPAGLEDRLGGGRGGYLGALVMGLTFAVTAFSCTAPFAGSVLAAAVAAGDANGWLRAVIGMAIYSSAIAVPFFFLAISPTALSRLPRAGAWMNEFKIVGGLLEIAAALKFLAISDNAWGWGVVGRTFTISAWSAICLLLALYVLGLVRLRGDERITEAGLGRVFLALPFLAFGLWFASGLCGAHLGMIEGFFPGDNAPPGW